VLTACRHASLFSALPSGSRQEPGRMKAGNMHGGSQHGNGHMTCVHARVAAKNVPLPS
jgi:hypothetical protein